MDTTLDNVTVEPQHNSFPSPEPQPIADGLENSSPLVSHFLNVDNVTASSSPEPQPIADGLENSSPLALTSLNTQAIENPPSTPPALTNPAAAAADGTESSTRPPKKRKRGNQGKFQGPQLAFLQSRIDTYHALSSKKERSSWIVSTTHEYFQAFPWHNISEPAQFAVLRDASASLSEQERDELEAARDK
ncbi:hypothetical protein EV360DRAFT_89197 [Lentinula raphanica]|nr:hypothetical protein EV360DRAFT_89197 [Lentinula raphanica]